MKPTKAQLKDAKGFRAYIARQLAEQKAWLARQEAMMSSLLDEDLALYLEVRRTIAD